MTYAPSLGERTDISAIETLCDSLAVPGTPIPPGADVQIADALLRRDFDPLKLATAAWQIMCANPQVRTFLEAAWQSDDSTLDRVFDEGVLIALYDTPLMTAVLKTTPLPSLHFERLTAYVRRRLLERAVEPAPEIDSQTLNVASAIAIHVFLTEYIYVESEKEKGLVEVLLDRVSSPSEPDVSQFEMTVLGSYRSLTRLFENVSEPGEGAGLLAPDVARIMVEEPLRDLELSKGIEAITPIQDSVSSAVREQYEAHPYPRWVSAMLYGQVTPSIIFQASCHGVDLSAFGQRDSHRLLFAGCGTGKIAIEEGALWQNAQILALDLSRSSLAYGLRRARELGFQNLTFAQGDILSLPETGRQFDYISCSGVLHHMADPIAGWKALVKVCRPGGVMRICLYSELARAPIRHVQSLLGNDYDDADSSTIKRLRYDLISRLASSHEPDNVLAGIFSIMDMYTTSMCRDLLFHVHETDFTIPQIARAVDDLGLTFCGFVDPTGSLMEKYRTFAPQDPDGLDLASWHEFELQNPNTFAQMYDFMVQKPL